MPTSSSPPSSPSSSSSDLPFAPPSQTQLPFICAQHPVSSQFPSSSSGSSSCSSAIPYQSATQSISLHSQPRAVQLEQETATQSQETSQEPSHDEDEDPALTEVLLSLLARREVEHRMHDRHALQVEKIRTRKFKRHALSIDQSHGLEHALSLAESIPSGLSHSDSSIPCRLPGGRGMHAPHDEFLHLGVVSAGVDANPFEKVHHGTSLSFFCTFFFF